MTIARLLEWIIIKENPKRERREQDGVKQCGTGIGRALSNYER